MGPLLLVLAVMVVGVAVPPPAQAQTVPLERCRLKGVEHDAWCGKVTRPLDPAAPAGRQIDVHFAVLPALARHKKPDPLFFFAGGPGQSAIALAGPMSRQFARFSNRRDVVLIDQRGTGRSAPLYCDADAPTRPLREVADPVAQAAQLEQCLQGLLKLPHGDLQQYTTSIAMADADAVRVALGAERINVIGGSYGTRAVLELLRQFPHTVRRAVIDGVAPPDMVLPASFSPDAQASFDVLVAACRSDVGCATRYPGLRADWDALLAGLPRTVTVPHPVTGRNETLTLTHDIVAGLVRLPLYSPVLASALPYAVSEAAHGRFVPLMGLANALAGGRGGESRLAMGMHFSVVCAEDMPRMPVATDRPGPDFGVGFADLYRKVCESWPRGTVPAGFYRMPESPSPVLVLSGGIDPVTPPRHGARAAKALGAKARHVVVPHAGHGVMAIGCMRDVLFHFIDAEDDATALAVDASCATSIPRPPAFSPARGPEARPGAVGVP